jgi:hypothetical protein
MDSASVTSTADASRVAEASRRNLRTIYLPRVKVVDGRYFRS